MALMNGLLDATTGQNETGSMTGEVAAEAANASATAVDAAVTKRVATTVDQKRAKVNAAAAAAAAAQAVTGDEIDVDAAEAPAAGTDAAAAAAALDIDAVAVRPQNEDCTRARIWRRSSVSESSMQQLWNPAATPRRHFVVGRRHSTEKTRDRRNLLRY